MDALVDPTTGRPVYSGPAGEGGSGSREGVEAFARQNGLDPSQVQMNVMPDGRSAYYLPGQFVQNGNRAALGLDPLGSATSIAPGANSLAVKALVDSTKRQVAPKVTAPPRDFGAEASLLFPFIPSALRDVFVQAWAKYGSSDLAMAELRRDPRYDQFFAGNKRADGSVILPESEYLSNIEGYDRRLRMFGQDPAMFRAQYVDLIQGGKSPDEFEADLAQTWEEVVGAAPASRQWYVDNGYAADVTDQAFFASRLQPGTSPQEFDRRFKMAAIGGAAAMNNFTIGRGQAERLAQLGVSSDQAQQLYSRAAAQLPTLNELLARHNDPNDELTLDDFTNAVVLNDPHHLQTIARVLSEEGSLFTPQSLLGVNQAGGVTGLRAR